MNYEDCEQKFNQELLSAKEEIQKDISLMDADIKDFQRRIKNIEEMKMYAKFRIDRINQQLLRPLASCYVEEDLK